MKTAIVLGTFDGLHKGHRAVIEKARGYYTVAVTFDIPPKAYFGGSPELLMLPEDKKAGLRSLGADKVYTLDFGQTRDMSAEDFFLFLKNEFSPELIACGFNYRFGRGAEGDVGLLSGLCKQSGIDFKYAESVGNGEPVSSSALRALIAKGDVKAANEQIFGGFGFSSRVIHGDSRGKTLGFPTANQIFPQMLVKPQFGVYKSSVVIGGKEYPGITNIGVRPTYKTDHIGCETYISGLSGEIYDSVITLRFCDFIRKEIRFSTNAELQRAVKADIKAVLGIEI